MCAVNVQPKLQEDFSQISPKNDLDVRVSVASQDELGANNLGSVNSQFSENILLERSVNPSKVNLDDNLPVDLKSVSTENIQKKFGGSSQRICDGHGKSSIAKPLTTSDLYMELQKGGGTCGIHAINNFIGTRVVSVEKLNTVRNAGKRCCGCAPDI